MVSDFVLRQPLPLGRVTKPLPAFVGMAKADERNPDRFFGVAMDGEHWIRNTSMKGVGDGHDTMTTGRRLGLDSTYYIAGNWLYEKPADLAQVGRNLFFQTQKDGSPVDAISTESGHVVFVWRNPTTMHREPLGAIPWGTPMFFIVGQRLGRDGFVKCWYSVGDWPDLGTDLVFEKVGINTWQTGSHPEAHNTIGHYRDRLKGGTYVGHFSRFAGAATPERALTLARA